jgi:uncharacterized membrane protein
MTKRVLALVALLMVLLSLSAPISSAVQHVATAEAAETTVAADPAKDPSFWRFGFYYNPDDPRLNVPKLSGLGLSINLAHPLGKVVMAGVLLALGVTLFFKYKNKRA